MATGVLRPNADVANPWSRGDWDSINDVELQPAGSGDATYLEGWVGDNNSVYKCGFPDTITDVDEVSNVTVWCWGYEVGGDPEITINIDGVEEAWQECTLPTGAGNDDWTSNSYNGAWTQANLDSLEVWLRSDSPVKNDIDKFSVVYVVITYSQVAAGWAGGDFIGVVNANISIISGVAIADIDNVKGV